MSFWSFRILGESVAVYLIHFLVVFKWKRWWAIAVKCLDKRVVGREPCCYTLTLWVYKTQINKSERLPADVCPRLVVDKTRIFNISHWKILYIQFTWYLENSKIIWKHEGLINKKDGMCLTIYVSYKFGGYQRLLIMRELFLKMRALPKKIS